VVRAEVCANEALVWCGNLQVIQAYEKEGFPMLVQAFNEESYLERLTGLDKLYEESEAAIAGADWGEKGGNSDEDDF
jgi:ubiquitin-like modifier-activating enzyme ATG7